MTVTAHPKDAAGAALAAKITAQSAQATALGNGSAKFYANDKLRQLQTELVDHYMAIGRLDPASILSTMT